MEYWTAVSILFGLINCAHRIRHHWRSNQHPLTAETETLPPDNRFMVDFGEADSFIFDMSRRTGDCRETVLLSLHLRLIWPGLVVLELCWSNNFVRKLLVLPKFTLEYITLSKLFIIYRSIWYHKTVQRNDHYRQTKMIKFKKWLQLNFENIKAYD